jgi:hypothetical protein
LVADDLTEVVDAVIELVEDFAKPVDSAKKKKKKVKVNTNYCHIGLAITYD